MQITHCVETRVVRTPRVKQLEGMFDVPPSEVSRREWSFDLPLKARPWQIGLIVGPSGSGKSTLARTLWPDQLAATFAWPADKSLLDGFPIEMSVTEITELLSSVGFSSPPSWLRPFHALSNGEQFRVTLARTLAEQRDLAVVDAFTSVVDRTVAQIGSHAVAKAVRRRGGQFVAVGCHYDVIDWLDPDWVFDLQEQRFHWRSERRRPAIVLDVQRVHRRAWSLFSLHHYLSSDLSRSATCFLGTIQGRPAVFTAVTGFPHPHRPGMREHRTVCLPDFQGAGIAPEIVAVGVNRGRRSGRLFGRRRGEVQTLLAGETALDEFEFASHGQGSLEGDGGGFGFAGGDRLLPGVFDRRHRRVMLADQFKQLLRDFVFLSEAGELVVNRLSGQVPAGDVGHVAFREGGAILDPHPVPPERTAVDAVSVHFPDPPADRPFPFEFFPLLLAESAVDLPDVGLAEAFVADLLANFRRHRLVSSAGRVGCCQRVQIYPRPERPQGRERPFSAGNTATFG